MNELDVVGLIRKEKGKTVANTKAVIPQRCGNAANTTMKFTKGRASPAGGKRRSFRIESGGPAKRVCMNH